MTLVLVLNLTHWYYCERGLNEPRALCRGIGGSARRAGEEALVSSLDALVVSACAVLKGSTTR